MIIIIILKADSRVDPMKEQAVYLGGSTWVNPDQYKLNRQVNLDFITQIIIKLLILNFDIKN
jgi:hypothetical protein